MVFVDVTFGGGGHSREILSRLGPNGKLFAFDQDEDALANAFTDERFTLMRILDSSNDSCVLRLKSVDGILADLGVSSHQFDVAERVFSI
jgi:16S rRNA (cytosine1402-N4)-methyltransferase